MELIIKKQKQRHWNELEVKQTASCDYMANRAAFG
jgi:hypothetical protein